MNRLVLGSLLVAACSSPPARPPALPAPAPAPSPVVAPPPAPSAPSADAIFEAFAKQFLADYLEHSPVDATSAGEHRFDGKWPDLSPEGEAASRAFLEHARASIPRGALGVQNQIDATIIDDQIRFMLFGRDQLKTADRDPVYYTNLIGEGFDPLGNRAFGTKDSRLAAVIGRLDGLPALLATAKQRLQHPAKINTETALAQCAGLIALVETELAARFPDGKATLAGHAKRAAAALHDFQDFLKTDLLPRSDGSFRLGRERFVAKLGFVLEDTVDIDAIAAAAHELLAQTQDAMVETAKQIWADDKLGKLPALATPAQRKAFVRRVLDLVAKDHPTNKTILADSKAWLAKATEFVRANNLVRVPDEPVAVVEMPEYRRGLSVAYCDSAGPLETTPETFFAISPTPSDWTSKRVDSFYREYNQAMLADLAVHEAMPGHYLQLVHSNQFKAPTMVRAIFQSGSGPCERRWIGAILC